MLPEYTPKQIARFWSKVDKSLGALACWLWLAGCDEDGYGKFSPTHHQSMRAHRLAYILTYGPIPPGMLVCHNCPDGDNPACVNPAHLFLGTVDDNAKDMVRKGRSLSGDRNPAHLHPERIPRGERHHWNARPETRLVGDRHPMRINPDFALAGERNGNARLTDDAVREIRRIFAAGGITQRELGERYGVSQVKISQIILRKSWKHVA